MPRLIELTEDEKAAIRQTPSGKAHTVRAVVQRCDCSATEAIYAVNRYAIEYAQTLRMDKLKLAIYKAETFEDLKAVMLDFLSEVQ